MEYDRIILEMLDRIKALEEKVEELSKPDKKAEPMMKTADIKDHILDLKAKAKADGEEFIILKANDLHKELNLKSRMPAVCNAMKQVMNENDEVLHETKSGFSSTYLVKYYLI